MRLLSPPYRLVSSITETICQATHSLVSTEKTHLDSGAYPVWWMRPEHRMCPWLPQLLSVCVHAFVKLCETDYVCVTGKQGLMGR